MATYDTIGGTPRHDEAADYSGAEYCVWLLNGYGYADIDPVKHDCSDCPVRQYCSDWRSFETCKDPEGVKVEWCRARRCVTLQVDGLTSRLLSEEVATALYGALKVELAKVEKHRLLS